MKVLCIEKVWVAREGDESQPLIYLATYTVLRAFENFGRQWYELTEYPGHAYCTKCFIPVDPTEEEIKEYSQPEKQPA